MGYSFCDSNRNRKGPKIATIERKLATVVYIEETKPIPNADRICAYRYRNWWVVDQIGKYNVGDKVIAIEIDSWVPHETAPFLTKEGSEPKEYLGVKGQRLKTIKLKGQISQGLIIASDDTHEIGNDVSESLGIIKWENLFIAERSNADCKGSFPSFLKKTDQERVQNIGELYDLWNTFEEWECTEKLDGSSMTVFHYNGEFGVCSRNFELKRNNDNRFWFAAARYDIEKKLSMIGKNIGIQGELIGPSIQGNPYNQSDFKFFVFDITDISEGKKLNPVDAQLFCKENGLDYVPVVNCPAINKECKTSIHDEMIKHASGMSILNKKTIREGVVFKPVLINGVKVQEYVSSEQKSFKVISNEYLLKKGD